MKLFRGEFVNGKGCQGEERPDAFQLLRDKGVNVSSNCRSHPKPCRDCGKYKPLDSDLYCAECLANYPF